MRPSRPSRTTLGLFAAVAAVVSAVVIMVMGETPPAPSTAQAQTSNPCATFGVQPVTLTSTLPTQFSPALGQINADCMAWQSFISLNWQADPNKPGQPNPNASPSTFGTPGDATAKVWESYLEVSSVFNPPSRKALLWSAKRPPIKSLVRVSKQGATDLSLSGISQAGDGKWLTNQSGGLTYYEVRINQDEFEFITTNVFSGSDLTTYAGQAACASQPGQNGKGGFNLPAGGGATNAKLDTNCQGAPAVYGANVGAIEIKAAWIALPADHSLDYRYKTAVAQVTAPGGQVSQVTVGLVGLHILRKVQGAPQFIWSTFEQIDNSPDEAGGGTGPTLPPNPNQKARGAYTYFNSNCTSASDPTYQCQHNALPGAPCNAQGQPTGCDPYSAAMQITRVVSVDDTANSVTGYVWSLLPANSVYNYYRLIDVQWPNSPTPAPPGSVTPLPNGDITPASKAGIVANTTMETYQQTRNACMDCHQSASIAIPTNQAKALVAGRSLRKVRPRNLLGAAAPYASNYSFVFVSETVR